MDISNPITASEFAQFLAGYCTALLWSSTDEVDGETVNLDNFDLSTAGADTCRADCLAFFTANYGDLCEAARLYRRRDGASGMEMAGHDFALTRNGHGAGFWDGDLPRELGARLTSASKAAGECSPYLGEEGEVHCG